MKNWQGIPTIRLTLCGDVMVPRNQIIARWRSALNSDIIAFATQGKSGHYKIFDG